MKPSHLKISRFDYPLPDSMIAQHPLEERDACRLLYRSADGTIADCVFSDLPSLLPPDAMLVCNNTRVINARLLMHKDSGAAIEIFCLEPVAPADYAVNFASTGPCSWLCFVGNSKRWKDGTVSMTASVGTPPRTVTLRAVRTGRRGAASVVELDWDDHSLSFAEVLAAAGVIPIPPYLNRQTEASDTTDYQTVYSRISGSVAAPTAGLHFTDAVLASIAARGIPRRELTLHVGAGTFQPVKDDDVSEHLMHSEFISVPLSLVEELASTERRVYAVGTTSVRTLESLYHIGCLISRGEWEGEVPQWYPYDDGHPRLSRAGALGHVARWLRERGADTLVGSTRIIIAPGYDYKVVDGMITNFHQPRSTLLLLVSAFIGDDWRRVYDHALAAGYRFLSYGDACLFERVKSEK